MGAWPQQSCGGEGGGGAIPEATPTAPTGEGGARSSDSGRGGGDLEVRWDAGGVQAAFLGRCGMPEVSLAGTSDRSRQLPPPKPQRRQRAHSCDKADAGPGPGGGGEAAAVLLRGRRSPHRSNGHFSPQAPEGRAGPRDGRSRTGINFY